MNHIRNFQQINNLTPVSGVIGPITLRKLAEVLKINRREHLAHFLGQAHHETGGFMNGRENMDYSVNGLLNTFGRHRISELDARRFGRTNNQSANQRMIANTIYGGEWGKRNLGNTKQDDGWLFRGNGSIQLTGRANHQSFSNRVNDQSIMTNPDLVIEKYYFESGKFFFDRNNLWRFCDNVNDQAILTLSRAVNIGNANTPTMPKGLADRIKQTNRYFKMLENINL